MAVLVGRAGLALLLCCAPAVAQHAHEMGPPLLGLTSPKDDRVLASAPSVIVLSFRSNVRLLKLRLLSAARRNIDIGFSYDPTRIHNNFTWTLPPLPKSSYYIVAWAVVDETDQLVDGEFRFAVGSDALPPSEFIKRYGLYVDHYPPSLADGCSDCK
jgi:methionine-rich copper-binding protein CopC